MADKGPLLENDATVGGSITRLSKLLEGKSDSARLDAQVLVAHILERERAWLLAHPEVALSTDQQRELNTAVEKLLDGVPLPYVLGEWEFYQLPFFVNPHVLIPRPETELLVDLALEWLRGSAEKRTVLDIGTGSGCIATAIAVNYPRATTLAGDISTAALKTAQANVARHGVQENVNLIQMNLMDGIPGRFDVLVANLPYIPTGTLDGLAVSTHEPLEALDGGLDGLDIIRRMLAAAPGSIKPGGVLLAELEHRQGAVAADLARAHFPDSEISILPDLAGKDRILRIDTR
ncbi:MAG: peptide chain release factor N(5)-glutamine methyltransferase [Anaerolineae bacterium]|nr:peptide chain release factor N(5)-glutamine methyltransferase [Anaerolineae bacterium]